MKKAFFLGGGGGHNSNEGFPVKNKFQNLSDRTKNLREN